MNKKILFAAVGAAIAASPMIAAQADVKVGGHAQVEYYQYKLNDAGATRKASGLIDNARGRFWIDASEDLGGGMKAMARYEFSVDTANGGQAAAASGGPSGAAGYDTGTRSFDQRTREKYVGLSGGFGTVTAGNLHGSYKRLGGVRWDPVNATVLEARGNGGQSGGRDISATQAHNGFVSGAVKWESGAVTGPVSVELMIAPNKNTSTAGVDNSDGNDMQAGVSFKPMPGLEVVAAIVKNKKQPSSTRTDQDLTKIGGRYNMGQHTFWVQLENADTDVNIDPVNNTTNVPTSIGVAANSKAEINYKLFGYSFKMGNNLFAAQYADSTFEAAGQADTDITYLSLAVLHSLSKNTTAHVGYRKSEYETPGSAATKENVFGAGLRVNF